jgi:hypothetical protein
MNAAFTLLGRHESGIHVVKVPARQTADGGHARSARKFAGMLRGGRGMVVR